MALNRAVFENDVFEITVKRIYGGDWYVQVLQMVKHIETVEFSTYEDAVKYVFEKYELNTRR